MTNTIWSVNILLGIGLIGVLYVIYHIFKLSYEEMRDVSIQDKKNQQNH
jgi:hypothetical protein